MSVSKDFLDITFVEPEGKAGIIGIENANGNGSKVLHQPLLKRYRYAA